VEDQALEAQGLDLNPLRARLVRGFKEAWPSAS
jgi:hypothetical protein